MKLQTIILTAVLSVASCDQALFAADMPVKAPPRLAATPGWADLSGMYVFAELRAGATSANLANGSVPSIRSFAAGADGGGGVGYSWQRGPASWIMADGGVYRSNRGTDAMCGALTCSVDVRWSGNVGVKLVGNIDVLNAFIPDFGNYVPVGLPIPAGAANPTSFTYIGLYGHVEDVGGTIGTMEAHKWRAKPELRVGILTKARNNMVIDTFASVTFASQKIGVSPLAAPMAVVGTGTTGMAGVKIMTGI